MASNDVDEAYRELHSVSEVIENAQRKWRYRGSVVEKPVHEALGFYAASDVKAPRDVPPFNRSVVDGCATKYELVMTASTESPVFLSISGGEVVLVNTGDEVPDWSDVVVPIEYCELRGDHVIVYSSLRPGYGIGLRGEDVRKGEILVKRGSRIDHVAIGVLASLGIAVVPVYARLRVKVFSTGDEIVEPWEERGRGKVFNSTGHMVASFLRENGYDAVYGGIIPDDYSAIISRLEESLADYDVVVFTGGTSKGSKDYTARALKKYVERNGGEYWHGVRLQPGRPMLVAVLGENLVLGLSGFPVAAWSELYVVFYGIVSAKLGLRWPPYPVVRARLMRRIASKPGFVEVYRARTVTTSEGVAVEPLRLTGSGVLSSLIRGNAVLVTEENISGYEEGEYVDVHILR